MHHQPQQMHHQPSTAAAAEQQQQQHVTATSATSSNHITQQQHRTIPWQLSRRSRRSNSRTSNINYSSNIKLPFLDPLSQFEMHCVGLFRGKSAISLFRLILISM